MENGAFVQKEQRLHFPLYFQIHCISKSSKGMNDYPGEKGLHSNMYFQLC